MADVASVDERESDSTMPCPIPADRGAGYARGVKAVVVDEYGSPEVLRLDDVPTPTPTADQVLVDVAATSVNLTDWEGLVGRPAYARIGGLRRPARPILGSDIAGVVVAVGSDVTRFRPGDEVYGDSLRLKGGFAELVAMPAATLAHKPPNLSFVEASTIPQAGAIATQGTRLAAPGRRVLINGAGGGTGTFAIQLAKRAGAHVTGVDNDGKLDFMRSLGADEVIDHRSRDFTRGAEKYDLILDLVSHRSVFADRRALARGGRYLWVGGTVRSLLRVVTVGALIGRVTGRRLGLLAVNEGPDHFAPLGELCAAGEIRTRIDRVCGLEDVADALRDVGAGRVLGKVVVEPVRLSARRSNP